MTELQRLLDQIARTHDCSIAAARGQPVLRETDCLPVDLAEFYTLAGGLCLFNHADYGVRVVAPEELVRANPLIVGEDYPDDITDSWYIVTRDGDNEPITIDCSHARLGRCHDSFWDGHGVVGSCPIVARSFTELIQRLFDGRGGHWYWLSPNWPGYGDAYAPKLPEPPTG